MATEVLAIIPARGGSKGVPRKNVLPLGGVPLVARTIQAAFASAATSRVVVSTDDEEIADVARAFGADVVVRPPELASDISSSEDALLHVLDEMRASESYEPDLVVFLQCTSPFTVGADIDGTIDVLEAEGAESAFAASRSHGFLWRRGADGSALGVNHDPAMRAMRQQREAEFLESGAVYVMRTAGFLASRHRFFGRVAVYELPPERVLEIDEPEDFELAEERLARLGGPQTSFVLSKVRALAMDFDGVHTDDRVLVDQAGAEAAFCSRRDGMGISMLRSAGVPMIVISKERVPIAEERCRKLEIPCLIGEDNKVVALQAWADELGLSLDEVAYVGNDINDVECLRAAGVGVVPSDAHSSAVAAADFVLANSGGYGAIREVCDLILAFQSPSAGR